MGCVLEMSSITQLGMLISLHFDCCCELPKHATGGRGLAWVLGVLIYTTGVLISIYLASVAGAAHAVVCLKC